MILCFRGDRFFRLLAIDGEGILVDVNEYRVAPM